MIRALSSNKKEVISAINTLKRAKVTGLDDPPAELFITAPAVSVQLLLPLIRKFWEFEVFPNVPQRGH